FAFDYPLANETGVAMSLVPRMWGAEYVRRLLGAHAEEHRSQILDLRLEYGLLTPFTSSLALDSEAAYSQQGVRRRLSRLRGVRLTSLTSDLDEKHAIEEAMPFAPLRSVVGCAQRSEAPSTAEADYESK